MVIIRIWKLKKDLERIAVKIKENSITIRFGILYTKENGYNIIRKKKNWWVVIPIGLN